jgi:hypothetical protein
MSFPAQRSHVKALGRAVPTLRRVAAGAFFCAAIFLATAARAEFSMDDPQVARSISGQFVVSTTTQHSRLFYRPDFATDTHFTRLEPALLAVAAERFKDLLWQQLGMKADSSWEGKIYLSLRPADSPDDDVTIASDYLMRNWDYHVVLPDILARTRYARALSSVLLLEIANRANPGINRSANVPQWLVDGLARQVLDEDTAKVILAVPMGSQNTLPQSYVDENERGLDRLASAREILQNSAALTFNQLSWPTDEQANGDDGGAYLASAQLFAHELLGLPGGQKKMRTLLARLRDCQNWQTAFFLVFHDDFKHPLDVEKWWSLRALNFAAHNSSSQWTPFDSSVRLARLLSVPVEVRNSSNSFPAHAQISLQAAMHEFGPQQRDDILRTILRNLELAQFRLAPQFAGLAAGYRDTVAGFLGELNKPRVATVNKNGSGKSRATVRDTLRKLDALDNRRRDMIALMNLRLVPRDMQNTLPRPANLTENNSHL